MQGVCTLRFLFEFGGDFVAIMFALAIAASSRDQKWTRLLLAAEILGDQAISLEKPMI